MFLIACKSLLPFSAIAIGIYSFQFMNLFFKMIFSYIFITIVTFTLSIQVIMYMRTLHLTPNNHWVYNISLPIEILFLMSAAYFYLKNTFLQHLSIIALVLFSAVYLSEMFFKNIMSYLNYTDSFKSLLIVVVFCIILYKEFIVLKTFWFCSPVICVSLGLIIYSGCSLPYISLFSYFESNASEKYNLLFRLLNIIPANIMYILFSISFWLIRYDALLKPKYVPKQ